MSTSTPINTDKQANTGGDALSLLGLLHVCSPALPVGAFAYSQGLEYAMDAGWCNTPSDIECWIRGNVILGFGCLDLPVYRRLHEAWQKKNPERIQYWNELLLAFRETRELYEEDIAIGGAYASWHLAQDQERIAYVTHCPNPTVVSMHALACVLNNIDRRDAMLGFAWTWVENQVACASKALPMGQTDAQKILKNMMPVIVNTCADALVKKDHEIASGLFGLAMASACHEKQYSRMFRS